MVQNIWSNIAFYCTNGHRKPVRMVIKEGNTPFYACPKYMRLDDKHPDGYAEGEKECTNNLSFSDAEVVVNKLSDIIQEALVSGEFVDFKGLSFELPARHITVKVLKYEDDYIRLGILNKRAANR